MNFARIPAEIKCIDQWVCANAGSKAPMRAWEFQPASSTDPATWSFFEQAVCAVQHGYYDNIGFVFHDNGYVGIDIDSGYDEDGFISPLAADIISHCKSYTEKSRSGRGFHILLRGSLPFDGRNNRGGVEIYRTGRYFIMTGDVVIYDSICDNQEAIDHVLATYFQQELKELPSHPSDKPQNPRIYKPLWQKSGSRIPIQPTYPPIAQGGRNLSLLSLAGQLLSAGYDRKQMYDELMRCNREACLPPLGSGEVQSIVDSVTRYKR